MSFFGPFDEIFDFNHDGKLDTLEKAAEMDFMYDEIFGDEDKSQKGLFSVWDDDDDED